MPRFKSIIFYQYSSKIKLFLKKKCKIFKRWVLRLQTPKAAHLNSEFLPARLPRFALFIIIWVFGAFVLNSFFFIVQLQTL